MFCNLFIFHLFRICPSTLWKNFLITSLVIHFCSFQNFFFSLTFLFYIHLSTQAKPFPSLFTAFSTKISSLVHKDCEASCLLFAPFFYIMIRKKKRFVKFFHKSTRPIIK